MNDGLPIQPARNTELGASGEEFQNLHEFARKARSNLNQNAWDYVVGAAETETTMRRNRMALDEIAFRPRVLNDVSQGAKPTTVAPAESVVAASAAPGGNGGRTGISCGSHEKTPTPSGRARSVAPASIAKNTASVRPPIRPMLEMSATEATPVITSDTTNGITVIRIAFTHNVPIGVTASAAWSRVASWDAEMAMPPSSPAPNPTRTRVPSFMAAPTS